MPSTIVIKGEIDLKGPIPLQRVLLHSRVDKQLSAVKRFWGKTSLSEWLTTLIGARATSQMAQRATRPVYHIHSMQQHMSRGERCGCYNLTLWSQVCKVCIVRTLHTQLPNTLSPRPGPARHLVWPADGMVLSVNGLTGSFHTVWVPPYVNMSHGYDSLYPMLWSQNILKAHFRHDVLNIYCPILPSSRRILHFYGALAHNQDKLRFKVFCMENVQLPTLEDRFAVSVCSWMARRAHGSPVSCARNVLQQFAWAVLVEHSSIWCF